MLVDSVRVPAPPCVVANARGSSTAAPQRDLRLLPLADETGGGALDRVAPTPRASYVVLRYDPSNAGAALLVVQVGVGRRSSGTCRTLADWP